MVKWPLEKLDEENRSTLGIVSDANKKREVGRGAKATVAAGIPTRIPRKSTSRS